MCCGTRNLGKSAKKGSDNPQITITDLAHWHWQSGVIYQKPSYLLRRLNKGAKPHPGIGSKEDHSSKNLVATWKQQPVLSLGVSQLATGCVTCHTSHGSVTHFRPILGNLVEVTLVTSPFMYIVSHAKGTSFP